METLIDAHPKPMPFRSYPTYEEWKQRFISNFNSSILCSYPTYEEWKPRHVSKIIKLIFVLILPMRNGNNVLWTFNPQMVEKFLSYLWGMETFVPTSYYGTNYCSYPTYEEWKPLPSFLLRTRTRGVLILPMRNGN